MSEDKAALVLVKEGLCASPAEAAAIVSGMLSQSSGSLETLEAFAEAISACFDLEEEVVRSMYVAVQQDINDDDDDDDNNDEASVNSAPSGVEFDEEGDDDDGMYIGEGECELCERDVLLTRHHMIPRSTWPRLAPRLLNAFCALEHGDTDKAEAIAGDGLKHFLSDYPTTTTIDRAEQRYVARQMLQRVCLICRNCHSAVHRTHDNMTLAAEYNTGDKLIQDPAIYKFCKWASKQKPSGKYAARK